MSDQRVRNDGVVSQIFLLTQSVFEMSPPRLWELQFLVIKIRCCNLKLVTFTFTRH